MNVFCIQITFNNSIKVCFSNKKYTIIIQTRATQIKTVYFLLKIGLKDFKECFKYLYFSLKMTGDQVIALNLLCLIFGITIVIALPIVVALSLALKGDSYRFSFIFFYEKEGKLLESNTEKKPRANAVQNRYQKLSK